MCYNDTDSKNRQTDTKGQTMKQTNAQLKATLKEIIKREERVISSLETSQNPQVKEMVTRVQAELMAFESVLDALNGSNALLNSYK